MSNKKASFIQKNISIPTPVENDNERYNIIDWGFDNYYPYFLNFLYQNSAIQSGIINSKVHYTTSGGLNYEGIDKESFLSFFSNGNSDYSLDEIAEQMSKDLEISNMFCLRGVWSLDKSRCDKLEVVDFEKVRYRLDDELIAVCNDWSDIDDNTIKLIEPFNPSDRSEREFYLIYQEKSKQSIYNDNNFNKKKNKVNKSIYPQPPYSGGITSILTDVKINRYQLNEISNGFSTGTIINLNNGIPTDDAEKKAIERDIQDNATGEDNAGGTIILYNNGKDNEASVLSLNGNDLKDRYTALSQDNRDNIILSHSVTTPILFGIKTEGSLGNATELEIGYKIMKANYFKYKQRAILSALNSIGKQANGLQGEITFNEVNLDFLPEEVIPTPSVFNKEKQSEDIDVANLFNKSGRERPTNCLLSKSLPAEFDAEEERIKMLEEFKKQSFANLSAIENQVLGMLEKGNDYNSIRKALGINGFKLSRIYKRFKQLGFISAEASITNNGLTEIARQDVTKIEIFYSYAKNPDVSGNTIIPTSRDFCKALWNFSSTKVWSREDIDNISSRIGYNAFAYRGGWFYNDKLERATPYCRHIWKQEIFFT
tara:strand:+ start:2252 stop:4045 length:1794 start_codon:yes stop_codon:yes gene_type:complete